MIPVRSDMTFWGSHSSQPSTKMLPSGQTARLMVSQPIRAWREAVMSRLNELCCLPKGWDGYKADPVSFETANFALRMLDAACSPGAPIPSIVPGPNRDLQVEWHLLEGDIELHVRSPNDVHAWRFCASTDEDGDELELTNDFTVVADWIKELSERSLASQSTAA